MKLTVLIPVYNEAGTLAEVVRRVRSVALAKELILACEHDRLVAYQSLGEAARLAVPTNEHYLPLLYILALQQPGETVEFFAEGVVFGSISMRSLCIG